MMVHQSSEVMQYHLKSSWAILIRDGPDHVHDAVRCEKKARFQVACEHVWVGPKGLVE